MVSPHPHSTHTHTLTPIVLLKVKPSSLRSNPTLRLFHEDDIGTAQLTQLHMFFFPPHLNTYAHARTHTNTHSLHSR